ncbi:putative 5'-nucleotidase [Seiridium cardinale]|uniref:5'-nucleotidase n=1 Tax=Seiridium cardinale TaxID=138064 RepID=A0ABR2Y3P2_9PEZI
MLTLRSLTVAGLASLAGAEDVLYSNRLSKRFLDSEGNYNISFYHINDVHAHLDEFSSSGTDCTNPAKGCYGGYARVKTIINETRPSHEDSLFLNVGDEFQGTLFYTFYKGEKIAETLNQLGFDAMTLGNHEFDGGDEPLGDFLQNLTFPIVSANIVSDNEKLNSTIKPYHIFEEYGLAVIGVTTQETPSISSPGDGTTFGDPIVAVQNTIDLIKSVTNITRIAAITHIGYDVDIKLAQETSGLFLIMGGHSHTLLGDMEGAEGKYPTIETNKDGDEVFIVTSYRWGEYLGYIDVTYDADGKVLAYHGAPIHLTNTTAQDEDLQSQIEAWRVPFEAFAAEEVGETNIELDQSKCYSKECVLGGFMADAMYQYRFDGGGEPSFALINGGGVRATIDAGSITRGEVLTAFPFGNAIVEVTYSGETLRKILEGLVSMVNQFTGAEVGSFFQLSKNIKVEYNPDNEVGSRLVSVTIGDEPLDTAKDYNVVTIDFLTGGGDNFLEETDASILDLMDEVLVSYIQAESPVPADYSVANRIVVVDGQAGSGSGNATATTTGTASTSTPTGSGAGHLHTARTSIVLVAFMAIAAVMFV